MSEQPRSLSLIPTTTGLLTRSLFTRGLLSSRLLLGGLLSSCLLTRRLLLGGLLSSCLLTRRLLLGDFLSSRLLARRLLLGDFLSSRLLTCRLLGNFLLSGLLLSHVASPGQVSDAKRIAIPWRQWVCSVHPTRNFVLLSDAFDHYLEAKNFNFFVLIPFERALFIR